MPSIMQLCAQAIEEFKQIYFKQFGEMLSDDEARDKATRVFNLYKLLLKPTSNKLK